MTLGARLVDKIASTQRGGLEWGEELITLREVLTALTLSAGVC